MTCIIQCGCNGNHTSVLESTNMSEALHWFTIIYIYKLLYSAKLLLIYMKNYSEKGISTKTFFFPADRFGITWIACTRMVVWNMQKRERIHRIFEETTSRGG